MLFIDEIHRLGHVVEEILYPAMEDYALTWSWARARRPTVRLQIEHVTVIGATTRVGSITGPLRDRFGVTYASTTTPGMTWSGSCAAAPTSWTWTSTRRRRIVRPVTRHAAHRQPPAEAGSGLRPGRGSGDGRVTPELATDALDLLEIDERGLDAMDRRCCGRWPSTTPVGRLAWPPWQRP